MPDGNPLVAKAPTDGDGPGPFTAGNGDYGYAGGIGVAESAIDAFNGVKDGDWVAGGLGMLGLAGEVASAAIDPFGYLMSSVASFLMEHVQPLKDMLDSLAGDPPVIQSYADTWGNVAKSLEDSQVTYTNAVKNGTTSWTGAGADAYRESAQQTADALSGAATVAGGISTVVMLMGQVVSFVREFVRQLIADLIGKLISWVMEEVFSLGFGTPVVVAQAVTAISEWAARITEKLTALVETIRRVSPLLGKLADVFAKIIKIFGKLAGKVTGLDAISTRNIKPGGFVQHHTPGSGTGHHGGSPDGDGGSHGSDGDSHAPSRTDGDGDSDSPSRSGSGESGDGHTGNAGDTSPDRARGTDDSPSTRDTSGAPDDTGSASHPGDSGSSPTRTTETRSSSHQGDSSPSPVDDSPGTPSHAGDSSPSDGTPSHRADSSPGENGTPSHASDSGTPSHAGDNSPSHTPDSHPTRTPDGDNTPSATRGGDPATPHTGSPSASHPTGGGTPTTSHPNGGSSPTTSHPNGGDTPSSAPPRHGDSTTSTSGSAQPATPRTTEPGSTPLPSQRGGDGTPGGTPQGQPMAGGMPPAGGGGTPGGTPGGSPGGTPGARPGGWTGTPGTPGTHTPRSPEGPSGPGRGPGRGGSGPEGRPRQPHGPNEFGPGQPVARGTAPTHPASREHADTHQHAGDHNGPERLTPDEVNQHHAEPTPAGSSYHRGDPDMGDLPHRVAPDPDGRHTVDVHVTPDGHARIGDKLYTPEEFADILRRNADYDGRPIRLIGCDAGSNDFAKRLSRELDTEVMAPSKPAWTDSNGRVFSSDYEIGPDGRTRPRIPPNGEWDVHRPDGSTHRASEDGFTPDTHADHKNDVDADSARDRGDGDSPDSTPDATPQYEPVPRPRVHNPDSPEFDRRFVDWNRGDDSEFSGPRSRGDGHPDLHSPHDLDESPLRPTNAPASPDGVPQALHGERPLAPNAQYNVKYENGASSRFFTDENGHVTHVEATPGIHSPNHNPDLRYPLIPGAQYRVPNFHDPAKSWTFHIGDNGKPDAMTGEPSFRGRNDDYRDVLSQSRSGDEGSAAFKNHPDHGPQYEKVRWAGGHLAANEMGGPGEYVNMHPQMAASNSGNYRDGWIHEASWRKQENELGKFARQPGQEIESFQVQTHGDTNGVPENVTMRWQEVVYKTDEHGNIVLENGNPVELSRVTKERDFPNDPSDINYGKNRQYNERRPRR